uniref:Ammonium transporter AmtB-like domain-containing protein n=1 Tax=Ananas comosus var. bracteatus TaxID=296719 RepID=A0A6V7QYQ1_ANACO
MAAGGGDAGGAAERAGAGDLIREHREEEVGRELGLHGPLRLRRHLRLLVPLGLPHVLRRPPAALPGPPGLGRPRPEVPAGPGLRGALPQRHPRLLPVRLRRHHADPHRRGAPRPHELQGLDALRPALAHLLLHRRRLQRLEPQRLPLQGRRHGLRRRLRHPPLFGGRRIDRRLLGGSSDGEGQGEVPTQQYPADPNGSRPVMDGVDRVQRGAPYAANIDASMAILNTHLCTATSLLVWLCLDMFVFGKPSVIGAVQGMITGLVCITPAAGLVQGWAAIIMGVLSGSTPWFTMMVLHKRIRFLKRVDDTLAVFHTHAVAGSLGGILTGIFAEPRLNRLFFGDDPKYVGLAYALKMGRAAAGFRQIGMQLAGIVFIISVNVTVTTLVCLLVRLAVPLRLSDDELQIGDDAIHGEDAYAVWGDGETYERSIHGVQNFTLPTTLAEAA